MRSALGLVVVLNSTLVLAQEPQPCTTYRSEVTLGALSGHRIDSIVVETSNPNLGKVGRAIARLHVRSRPEIIRRELLFAVGDSVDTLRVAESLRRLRKLQFLESAHVEGRQCATPTGEALSLHIVTRDSWTTRPDIKTSGGSPRVGLSEHNLLGTGQTFALSLVSHNRSLGAGVSTYDAFGFGTGMTTRAQYQRYYEGVVRGLSVARRQSSIADPWRAEADFWDQSYEPKAAGSEQIERTGANFLAGVRAGPVTGSHILYLLGGAETQRSTLAAADQVQVLGPIRIDRRFTGPQVGLSVVSASYDTLTWMLSSGAVVDVPRTFEGEFVVGLGKGAISSVDADGSAEGVRSSMMTHYDAWVGREWLPGASTRIVTDLWGSGYEGTDWHSTRVRGAISADHAATNGLWQLTLAAEHLTDPDPDVRALTIFDRALPFVPSTVRLAESALTMSLDRIRHLHQLGSSYELDGSVFGALSRRWDPAATTPTAENFTVGVVGLSLAVAPRRAGRTTVRLDYGIPVTAGQGVRRSPHFAITLIPWLEAGRHRDKDGTF